jgi:hypothetical protein
MKPNLKSDHFFNEDSVEVSITEAEKTKKQWDKIDKNVCRWSHKKAPYFCFFGTTPQNAPYCNKKYINRK